MADITDRQMSIKPGPRDIWLNESAPKGHGRFMARIRPNGERLFYYRYTDSTGARVRLPIGSYDRDGTSGLTLKTARQRARELTELYLSGVTDVREHLEAEEAARRAARDAEIARLEAEKAASEAALARQAARKSVAELFDHWARVDLINRKDGGAEVRRMFKKDVLPLIGHLAVEDVRKERSAGSYKVMLEKEATTPAQKKKLQATIPPYRKLTKPDLAKFLFAWDQKPHIVSLGSQKNFQAFMDELMERESAGENVIPDQEQYKQMIAKAILFKSAHKIIRPMFPAFQANITSYTVSILALKLGANLNLNRIWQEQSISPQLHRQIAIWAEEVNDALHRGAGGKMISEWAKKIECWWRVRDTSYSSELGGITELS